MFTGAFAINPTNDARIPIFIADYVLMGYGTGAIMAVPAHDERDFEFAREFDLPIVRVIRPSDEWLAEHDATPTTPTKWPEAYVGDGVAMNSANDEVSLDGLRGRRRQARDHRVARASEARRARPSPTSCATGCSAGSATGASRSRSCTTSAARSRCPTTMLPVVLPEITDFEPVTSDDPDALPEPPLARGADWVEVELDLPARRGRATATGRGLPPRDEHDAAVGRLVLVLPALPRSHQRGRAGRPRRSSGVGRRARAPTARRRPGSSTSTSAASSTRCCTCSTRASGTRCLFDLGHVSTMEPFQRLVNQGYILAPAYIDERGMYVEASRGRGARRRLLLRGRSPSRASSARWARA